MRDIKEFFNCRFLVVGGILLKSLTDFVVAFRGEVKGGQGVVELAVTMIGIHRP